MLGSAVSLEDLSPSRFFFFFYSEQQTNPTECQRLNNHDGKNPCVCCRLIMHTKALMSSEDKLCISVLRTLQEMLIRTLDFDEKVT